MPNYRLSNDGPDKAKRIGDHDLLGNAPKAEHLEKVVHCVRGYGEIWNDLSRSDNGA
jgi:hypothetical protein